MSDLSEAIERLTQSNEACGGSGSPYSQLPKGLYYLDVTAVCEAAGAEKADAAIRRRDDVIAEMGNRIAELEAEIENVRESIGIVQAENVRLRERIENLQSELTAECGQCGCSRLESKTQDGCITCEVIRMRAECLRLRKELEAACVSLRVFAIYTDNDALRGVYRRLGNRIDEILKMKS